MNTAQPNSNFVITPVHSVTNRNYTVDRFHHLVLFTNFTPYVNDYQPDVSNRVVQVVFFGNTNSAFNTSVYFFPFYIAAQWQWTNSDIATGVTTTNFLALTDDFGETTNLTVVVNGFVGSRYTFKPYNYQFYTGFDFSFGGLNPGAPPGLPPGTFDNLPATNEYSAYRAIFSAATQFPSDKYGGDITNLNGR